MSWPLVGGWRKGRVLVSGLYGRNVGRAPSRLFLSAFQAIGLIVPIFSVPRCFSFRGMLVWWCVVVKLLSARRVEPVPSRCIEVDSPRRICDDSAF